MSLSLLTLILVASAAFAAVRPLAPGAMLSTLGDIHFENMGAADGLPHDSIYGFTQDDRGFLWIATFGGLARFDGYRLRVWTHDPRDVSSLPDNNVRVLLPAGDGRVWLGTGNAGLILYDPASDSFHLPGGRPEAVSKSRIYSLCPDGAGGLWLGTEVGLAHYDPAHSSWELLSATGTAKAGFVPAKVFAVFRDSKGNVWAGGDTGLAVRRSGRSLFEFVAGVNGEGQLGERPQVWAVSEDAAGKIWVGSDGAGVGVVDAVSGRIRGIDGLAGRGSLIEEHTVRGFVETAPGVMWIATYGGGLVVADANTGVNRRWVRDATAVAPIANDFIRGIFRDQSGEVWLGTDNGLSRTNGSSRGLFSIHGSPRGDGFPGNEVRSIGAGDGRIWVGFDQGQFAVVETTGEVRQIRRAQQVPSGLESRREVLAMKPADETTVFAGGHGMFEIDARTLTYRPVNHPLLANEIVNALCVDGDIVWAGTYDGLVRYERKTGNAQRYSRNAGDGNSLSDNYVRDILKAADGRILVTTRLGLDVLDPKTGSFQHIRHRDGDAGSIAGNNVQSMMQDSKGRIWIGTVGSGLSVIWDWPAGREPVFRNVSRAGGLPDDVILTIAECPDGRVWANTPKGLAVVDPQTFKVRTLTAADGLWSTTRSFFSSVTLSDGTILFPGSSGITVVRPSLIKPREYRAALELTEVRVPGSTGPVAIVTEKARRGDLSLDSSHRGLQAEFALLDFTGPKTARYAYKLEGFDADWIETTPDRRTATYTNLPPQKYTLLVRASSRDGDGPETELSIPVEARPAWFETGWFRFIEGVLVIAAIFLIVALRTAFLRRREAELRREVEQRTAELEEKRRELESANGQLALLATLDPLTGLLNRRQFLELAAGELGRSRRSGKHLCILVADIDHFKSVNDTWGHLTGDAVLQCVSARITECFRKNDIISRYGGEEFVVLLPETDAEMAGVLAERLHDALAAVPPSYRGSDVPVTVSIGVAEMAEDANVDALLDRADQALYRAKREGRNRTASAKAASLR